MTWEAQIKIKFTSKFDANLITLLITVGYDMIVNDMSNNDFLQCPDAVDFFSVEVERLIQLLT